ncbi:MAG: ligand-binding protein SH3 [Methanoculleus sp. SDB]|nr:MAG: ligand-binding protein SH3 [Methanoculleus sp. SDB]
MDAWLSVIVLILSATPFFEARYAIPLAINTFGFAPAEAFLLGLLGNIVPVILLLRYLESVEERLSARFAAFHRFFTWLFERTRRHSERFERWGALALIPFVAVPLPVTGAWTACAAAFVFGIRFRYSLPAIAAGMVIAAVLTTLGITTLTTLLGVLGDIA